VGHGRFGSGCGHYPAAPRMNIRSGVGLGILGGTFDPPHIGHLAAAVNVRHQLGLDRVVLMVAGDPWQKRGTRPLTPAADRLAMVRAAVRGLPGIEAGDLEVRRPGPSYTADTLLALRDEDPAARLHVVLGRDAAASLLTWERVEVVRELAIIVVLDRPGAEGRVVPEGFDVAEADVPHLDVSSTDLRARFADGRPTEVLLPPGVASCIARRRLYGVRR